MKINLSKEEIKKGCDLITDTFFGEKIILYMNAKDVNLNKHSEISYYRDFLQLVIEAINKKGFNKYFILQDDVGIAFCEYPSGILEEAFTFDKYSITEAKEKAISYVFNNMEGEG